MFDQNIHVMTVILGFISDGTESGFIKKMLSTKPRDVAETIVRNQIKCKDVIYVKWYWRFIMFFIKNIPEFIFKRIDIK